MSEKIKLVKNDNRPIVTLTLTNPDGTPVSILGATIVVYFRAVGGTTPLATLNCSISDGINGICTFQFPGTTLNIASGMYEGEIEITFGNGDKQTVYDLLKFQLRDQIA